MDKRLIPDVYVLWHPSCAIGETLARRIYAWLRPGNGQGPQVFYRSLPEPEAPAGGLPMPLPGEHRSNPSPNSAIAGSSRHVNMQIVVLLIDDHMIADTVWRYWLTNVATGSSPGRRVFVPIALDSTAFNVPRPLRELNFLRPTGLPIPDDTRDGAAFDAIARSMLKQLTETLCRLLLGTSDGGAPITAVSDESPPPKVSIFLSHAKQDGTAPTRRIRDYIYSQTQLMAFFDENDIPFGSAFSRVLQGNLQSRQTAALIAVRSELYAKRPWCRRELSMFRRPWNDTEDSDDATQRWRLHPIVIVDALEAAKQTSGIPEFGNATLIRWSGDATDQEEQIVTTVLRDTLLAAFHSALARSLKVESGSVILNWLPDPTTLLHIPKVRQAASDVRVVYPGRGLSGLELDILDEFFPRVSFHSFDQVLA